MPPPKLFILDSNAYFRLAVSIHPLLGQKFGKSPKEQYVCRVIAQLEREFTRNPRLQNKFPWVSKRTYQENRTAEKLNIAPRQFSEVAAAQSYILAAEKEHGCNISFVDAFALAIGFVKGQPVVTDDRDMCAVAAALGIEVWGVLQVLKLMLDEGRIDLKKVIEIAQYLDYENDLPCGKSEFIKQFESFFVINPFNP